MWFWPWQLSLHTGVCLTLLLLPYREKDSDPDFITGPLLCVKLSAFSFIDSKAINVNKWWRYISVPRHSVGVHWASNSSKLTISQEMWNWGSLTWEKKIQDKSRQLWMWKNLVQGHSLFPARASELGWILTVSSRPSPCLRSLLPSSLDQRK